MSNEVDKELNKLREMPGFSLLGGMGGSPPNLPKKLIIPPP